MDYPQKQLQLIQEIEEKFKRGENPSTIVEPVKDYTADNRICLTSVVFIPAGLEQEIIENLIKPLQKADGNQYFYGPGSFHMTIQNIRTINNPPLFNQEDIGKTRSIFEKVVPKYRVFNIELKRLFELPTSLSICAFTNEILGELCSELRSELAKIGVPDNKTYASDNMVLGSTTVSRYTNEPNASFHNVIKELKSLEIGNFEVKTISLITTNAVCLSGITKIIGQYNLKQ